MEIPELLRAILIQRGFKTDEDIDRFLNPSLDRLARPEELPGITEAARIVGDATRAERKIVVFGDYDCDGVSATAILVKAIRLLGGDVEPFIPERLSEGYGMSEAAVERMLREHPDVSLVVTVDNGINALEPVLRLKEKHVEVVVTDHHLPTVNSYGQVLLPSALALVDPKVSAPPDLSELCGAAVAFLLARALVERATKEGWYSGRKIGGELLVMAGLATVTDVMPLLGQNRILVSNALSHFDVWAPIGLRKLLERAARKGTAALSSRDFGFLIGPRINAAGRLASSLSALELMLSEDEDIANEGSRLVELHNTERKNVEMAMFNKASERIVPGAAAQVIDLSDGHQGVAGIVAARVMESLEPPVPTCVIVGSHGSARAPKGYNVRDALKASARVNGESLLSRYGGHALAAGFSVVDGKIDAFREVFARTCAEQRAALPPEESKAIGTTPPDLDVTAEILSLENVESLTRLEPYGEGNHEPVFRMRNVFLKDLRLIGAEGKHLALQINGFKAVWWSAGSRIEEFRANAAAPYDVTFTVLVSTYGERHVELHLVSVERGTT